MKQITAIALSGGIDSLAAAYLLKQQGHHVTGIHFITGFETRTSRHPNNKSIKDSDTAAFPQIRIRIPLKLPILQTSLALR